MRQEIPLFPEAASTFAGEVDALYLFLVALSAFFAALIAVSIIFTAVRYRRRRADEIGGTFHANLALELTWTIIPTVIVLFIFFWGANVFFTQRRPPADATEYFGIAKQWMWKFQHPDGQREINTLHVPVDQPIKITMISQDVIHSFFVPAFRTKIDVLPGRYSTVWFEATKTGEYHLFCTEFCGAEHSKMTGKIVVQTPEEYEKWLAGGAPSSKPPADAGAELFASIGCTTCHDDPTQTRGPSLTNVYGHEVTLADGRTVLADDAYLRESIMTPAAAIVAGYQPIMPTYKGQISEENVFRLIAYIKSLAEPVAEADAAPADDVAAEEEVTE